MKDEIEKYIEDLFKIKEETTFEFKELYGFTFVFITKTLSIRGKISSAEMKPAGIIYQENDEYYYAPIDAAVKIEPIVKEFVKNCI